MSNSISINGFRLFGFTGKDDLLRFVAEHKGILLALNAEKLYRRNPELQSISRQGIGYADGVGAVLALKKRGVRGAIKIPGSEFWLYLIEELLPHSSFYFIGSTTEVVDSVVKKLRSEYPEIIIAGYRDGFLSASDIQQLEQDILSLKPDVIFVAQGSPRQEKLMSRLQAKHQAIYMGLGGSFDVYTGKVKRAPALFRNNGLEWLYRLISEPSRIKRQIVLVPFAFRLLLQRFD